MGPLEQLRRQGARRLVVKVDGDSDSELAHALAGVTVSRIDAREARLVLADETDSQTVLAAAMAAGRVEKFDFEERRLSEVFREAVRVKAEIIIPIIATFVGLRIFMRRRRAKGPRLRERPLSDISLVAHREIRERVKTPRLRVATLIVLLVVAAGIIIPVVRKGHESTVRVGAVGAATSAALRTTARAAAVAC